LISIKNSFFSARPFGNYFVPNIGPRYAILYKLQEVHFDLDLNNKAHVNIIYINMHETALVFQILTTLDSLGGPDWRKHMRASTVHTHISKVARTLYFSM